MARTARASVGGICYHVINRGNCRADVFHKPKDYDAFVTLIVQAGARLPMRVVGCSLMPNHFHLVLWPFEDGDLSRWMQWLMTAHVRRYHRHYGTSGHVWQGRFKAFPIQEDGHLLTVLRYVERNPLRAGLVEAAQSWPWSSLRWWLSDSEPGVLHPGPVSRPDDWPARVNEREREAELTNLRRCVNRGTPLGTDLWVRDIAKRLGLEASVRPRGRPKKKQ